MTRIATIILLLLVSTTLIAEIRFVAGDRNARRVDLWPRLEIRGQITAADADVNRLLPSLQSATLTSNAMVGGSLAPLISLDSPGGEIDAAMLIGRILRGYNALTIVPSGAQCSSACVLVLAAGAKREVYGGRVGLHRPYFDDREFARVSRQDASKAYAGLESRMQSYLADMGMPNALFERMRAIPSRSVVFLKATELADLRLVGYEPAMQELERAKEREHFSSSPQSYEHIQSLRNCMETGKSFSICEQMGKRAYSKGLGR